MYKSFFSYCFLHGPCTICVYFMSNFFLCYLYSIFKKYLSVVSSCCVYVVFILFFLHLSVCYASLWFIPHPIVAITNLRIYGMYMHTCMHEWVSGWVSEWGNVCVCVCVCVCKYLNNCSFKLIGWRNSLPWRWTVQVSQWNKHCSFILFCSSMSSWQQLSSYFARIESGCVNVAL